MLKSESKFFGAGALILFAVTAFSVLFSGQPAYAQEETDAKDNQESQLAGFEVVHLFPQVVPFGEGELLTFAIQYGLIYAGAATSRCSTACARTTSSRPRARAAPSITCSRCAICTSR